MRMLMVYAYGMPNADPLNRKRAPKRTPQEWAEATTANCARCKLELPLDRFYPLNSKNHPRPVAPNCKECQAIYRREYYVATGGMGVRKSQLKAFFGLTLEQYEEMLVKQQGVCAVCKRPQSAVDAHKKFLPVDHDHETGRVRGLLCTLCNQALGLFGDDVERMRQAIAYLEGQENK